MASYGWSRAAATAAMAALVSGCAASGVQNPPLASRLGGEVRPHSDTERVLYAFSGGNDGGNAATGLALDPHGNLYGTTVIGGTFGCGTAFELAPRSKAPWTETVLHDFDCYEDGKNPHGGVTFAPNGALDGTTVAGGGGICAGDGCGVVFQLKGGAEKVLHDFRGGKDGFGPGGAVTYDASGSVFGTTPDGGKHNEGVVYELAGSGARRPERSLHAFTGRKDGAIGSLGPLTIDASGNLFGVTEVGGRHAAGTVFELSPGTNGSWTFRTLYAFKGAPDAASPYGGVVADSSGNLYGTTYYGGTAGAGTVFALIRNARGGYRERVLYSFTGGGDGGSPTSALVFSSPGRLYGTTSAGGTGCGCGVIFEVDASSGQETVLHAFAGGQDGAYAYYGLTADSQGNLYGTTVAGGQFGQGTVFEYGP